jgi:uncharacterized membrane protein (GlpM family)
MPLAQLLNSRPIRLWMLTTLITAGVFLLTRCALLAHSVIASQQGLDGMLVALLVGLLRDLPCAAFVASPWAFFALLPHDK